MKSELFMIIIAGLLIYAGIRLLKNNLHLLKVGIKTIGTVVSTKFERTHKKEADSLNDGVYRSTVKFTTLDNQRMTIELDIAGDKQDPIGAEKKLIYDPQFPQKAKSNNQFMLVILPGLIIGIGMLLFIWSALELFTIVDFIK